ncbi:uncharacterized protein LOC119728722 [Patiria miniata]|uniref:THAP-type domain-containing protein n=1 Tax=Patiria miniata TaxID=46514 RepID=A0A913ZZW7_PATMI|nr:uncharacterized protein LOC119728722 [Patiria miniata]
MVTTCAVKGCRNRADPAVKRGFFLFPKIRTRECRRTEEFSRRRRETWIARLDRKDWTPSQQSRVCSDHFVQGKPAGLFDTNNPDWAPSLKLAGESAQKRKASPTAACVRSSRSCKRERRRMTAAESLLGLSRDIPEPANDAEAKADPETSGDLAAEMEAVKVPNGIISPLEQTEERPVCDSTVKVEETERPTSESVTSTTSPMPSEQDPSTVQCANTSPTCFKHECQNLERKNIKRKGLMKEDVTSEDSFKDNDSKVTYYTGLPSFKILMVVFNFVKLYIHETGLVGLNKFQMLILTLIRLRLNQSLEDLGHRFHVSQATASQVFLRIIHTLYISLQGFVVWPDREELRKTMPVTFRQQFGCKLAVVVDCFEMSIERPSDLLARAQTWSRHKHHNTVKYLIATAPQGSILFISSAWGGRASDKYVTTNSGLLDKLLPGDLVLASRGFEIAENAGLMCAEVNIPCSTEGKPNPMIHEIEITIAPVRMHAERIIGLTSCARSKFAILSSTIPVTLLHSDTGDKPVIDKIVSVCCALTNICESPVPFN